MKSRKKTLKMFNKTGLITAQVSFALGSILLMSYAITKIDKIAFIGFFYLYGAVVINLLIAIGLFVNSVMNAKVRSKNLKTIVLMLLNIPIAYLYFIIVIEFLNF